MFRMTETIFRNFFSKRATRPYPYSVRPPFELARGEISNNIGECTFCSVCALKCPSQCITVDKKNATWSCDPYSCVYCGLCAENCPSGSLNQKREYRVPVRIKESILMKGEIRKEKKKAVGDSDSSATDSESVPSAQNLSRNIENNKQFTLKNEIFVNHEAPSLNPDVRRILRETAVRNNGIGGRPYEIWKS